jgi:hypothetical protein
VISDQWSVISFEVLLPAASTDPAPVTASCLVSMKQLNLQISARTTDHCSLTTVVTLFAASAAGSRCAGPA